jgi:hypothetical protein
MFGACWFCHEGEPRAAPLLAEIGLEPKAVDACANANAGLVGARIRDAQFARCGWVFPRSG